VVSNDSTSRTSRAPAPPPWRLALLLLAAGCTAYGVGDEKYVGGYWWVADPQAPYCARVEWKQVARERIPGLCNASARAARHGLSCAIGCLVLSPYSEREARRVALPDGDTLYRHEARHVLRGWVHPARAGAEEASRAR
jgi:hypothetical protein